MIEIGLAVLGVFFTGWQVYLAYRDKAQKPDVVQNDAPKKAAKHRSAKKLILGVYPYSPLMIGMDDPEEFTGIWVDLGKTIATSLGKEYEIQLYTMSDLSSDEEMSIDIALGMFSTEERRKRFEFSRPIHRIGMQGICASSAPEITPELLAKGDMRIVVQGGEVGWEYAKTELEHLWKRKQISVVQTLNIEETMDFLSTNNFDLAIHDELTCAKF